uniref:Uncharacterized protein n=1 Tax=uncultured marine Nitrospinaceae bacterium TaxID=482920 RepID=A4GIZ9_9BACT|nr:hypothetical protein [uncultured marine Nitrospinaceae bacterium]
MSSQKGQDLWLVFFRSGKILQIFAVLTGNDPAIDDRLFFSLGIFRASESVRNS